MGTSDPNSSLPTGCAHQRGQFELTQIIPLLAVVVTGVVFYAMGKPTRSEVAPNLQPRIPVSTADSAAEATA